MEVLWRSGALEGRNSLENGSLEIGSFRKDIITQMEAFANREGGKFAEWLRMDNYFSSSRYSPNEPYRADLEGDSPAWFSH